MGDTLVFKTGLAKRLLGWFVVLGATAALLAMAYAFYIHRETQTSADLLSAIVIGLFLIGLGLMGIAIQYRHWKIVNDAVVLNGLFKNRAYPLSAMSGFGQLTIIVSVFPMAHVELYDSEPKLIARLPIMHADWPRAEAWLGQRLRRVVNDGSAAIPRLRFVDTTDA